MQKKTEFIKSGSNKSAPHYAYIPLDGHRLQPMSSLKHLGFIWSVNKAGIATLRDENLNERINKFRAGILSLIRGGIRFCAPSSIVHLYKMLAVPTLSYGLELCALTQTQLEHLDRVGRVAIKQLFNISRYSKNYINNIFDIQSISTTINNNKMCLLTRLMQHESTRTVVLGSAQQQHQSFLYEVLCVADSNKINIYDIILNNDFQKLSTTQPMVDQLKKRKVEECFKLWNISSKRKEFVDILEERVLRA